ncbi:beta subunit of N-acylethanolamine-hydrolyzing acid amidase-domain-containing protein [Aspergillus varians]
MTELTIPGETPPTHRINLSLPPAARYVALARLYRPKLIAITSLFDDLVLQLLPPSYLPRIKFLARFFLRRVYDDEETQEIRGIADATGVEMYLVVALNVFLDLLMGCTSGAVLSSPPPSTSSTDEGEGLGGGKRMLHFRTLDWDMPMLRDLLVKLEFVTSDAPDAPVIATNITYVGFVGVLTGVRQGLSVSLNFRPNHDASSWVKQVKYYGAHLLVLLGFKRSISSVLREVIIPSSGSRGWWGWLRMGETRKAAHELSLPDTVSRIVQTPSTACYLILCDGVSAYVLEKDYKTTKVESSSEFIVATNSDRMADPRSIDPQQELRGASLTTEGGVSALEFIKDSVERRDCIQAHWDMKVVQTRQAVRRASQGAQARRDPLGRTRSSQERSMAVSSSTAIAKADTASHNTLPDSEVTATLDEIVTWTTRFPTTNEMTHFATVMDPARGTVAWIRRYPEPLECDWELTDFD